MTRCSASRRAEVLEGVIKRKEHLVWVGVSGVPKQERFGRWSCSRSRGLHGCLFTACLLRWAIRLSLALVSNLIPDTISEHRWLVGRSAVADRLIACNSCNLITPPDVSYLIHSRFRRLQRLNVDGDRMSKPNRHSVVESYRAPLFRSNVDFILFSRNVNPRNQLQSCKI